MMENLSYYKVLCGILHRMITSKSLNCNEDSQAPYQIPQDNRNIFTTRGTFGSSLGAKKTRPPSSFESNILRQ